MSPRLAPLALALASACAARSSSLGDASDALPEPAPGPAAAAPAAPPGPSTAPASGPVASTPGNAPAPTPATSSAPPARAPGDDPRISRSPGVPGGVVVLWPRVIPADLADISRAVVRDVQTHARALAGRALPGRPVDLRPEPERACRRAGCEATAVGLLFTRQGDGCAVVAVITPPGPVDTTLVPWAGSVELRATQIPFREPPESHVTVRDLVPCDQLVPVMRQNDLAVEAAVRAATPAPPR